MPADRAASTSLRLALISIAVFWLGVLLTSVAGSIPFLLGLVGWLALWTASVGLGVGALRNAFSSATPSTLRRKAAIGIGVSTAHMLLVCLFVFSILQTLRPA